MKRVKGILLHVMLFVFMAAILVIAYLLAVQHNNHGVSVRLNDNWAVKINDSCYYEVNLDEFRCKTTKRGDWVVLYGELPQNLTTNGSLCVYTCNSVMSVYIDGEQIYTYGGEDSAAGNYVGYGNCFITLPADAAGSAIKITYLVTENNSFSTIKAPVVYEESSVIRDYLHGKTLLMMVSVALVGIGICISAITFVLYFKSYSMEKMFCIGIFALCAGMWSLCTNDLEFLFTTSLKVKTILEYLCTYLMMLPLLLYFREDVEKRNAKAEMIIYFAIVLIQVQLFLVATVLQLTNIVHFSEFKYLYYGFIAIIGVFLLYLIIRGFGSENNRILLMCGFIFEAVASLRDATYYGFMQLLPINLSHDYTSLIPIASMIFVSCMFVDFIFDTKRALYASAENKVLQKIAYVDVLTGLNTRRKIEEIFDNIDRHRYEYAIIQFDVNNLKTINDTRGHEKGDLLLTRFSDIMKATFNHDEVLGRMGGDEFIAIIPQAYDYNVDEVLGKLDSAISTDNEAYPDSLLSVSYGYCRSSEMEVPVANQVYMIADRRMYMHKEMYYKTSGRGRRRYD